MKPLFSTAQPRACGSRQFSAAPPLRWLLPVLAMAFSAAVAAKDYPANPIKLIVPYSVGGPSDLIARIISQKASELIGAPIVVDNRGGAGGVIGTTVGAKSAPDGYTVVMVSPGQVGIAVATQANLPYNPQTDLVPVIELVEDTLILAASNKLPVNNVRELIAYMKAHPGELNYSSASVGSLTHMVMELFKQTFGVDAVHIPFKGSSESMMAVVTGEVGIGFASPSGMKQLLQEGKLRALAVASERRTSVMPEVPTMAEMGFKNLDSPLWYSLAVPKGTPAVAIDKLHDAYAAALKDPAIQERLKGLGVEPIGASPEIAAKLMAADIARWKGLVKAANLKLE